MPFKEKTSSLIRVKETKEIGTFGGTFKAFRVIEVEEVTDNMEVTDEPLTDWQEVK